MAPVRALQGIDRHLGIILCLLDTIWSLGIMVVSSSLDFPHLPACLVWLAACLSGSVNTDDGPISLPVSVCVIAGGLCLCFKVTKSVMNKFLSVTYYPGPNPDDAGPIVRCPMGLPITSGCDTAWNQTIGTIVTPLVLRCSALDHCVTREP